jgi:lipopolysaccharide transport system permease protein
MKIEAQKPVTVIQPPHGWALPDFREVWKYRGIIFNFVNRGFVTRYRQTIGGPIYAIYQPFMNMVGYSILLGGLFNAQTDGDVPYPLFSISALIAWTLFTSTVTDTSVSLQKNTQLIQKIYIPRLIYPIIEMCMSLVEFAIAFIVVLIMLLLYGRLPTINIVWIPLFLLIASGCGLGIGLGFAGLHARFRDTTYIVGFITRGLFFLTPVVYSSQLLPAPWDAFYTYNPLAVVVEGFRWALLGVGTAPTATNILISLAITFFLLFFGALYFNRLQPTIADVI